MHWTNQPVGKDAFVLTNTARHQQSRKFLECFWGNFFTWVVEYLTSAPARAHTQKQGRARLRWESQGPSLLQWPWEADPMKKEQGKKQDYKIRIQESRFLPTEEKPMQRRVYRRDGEFFKDHPCQTQDWPIAMCRKLGKGNRTRLSLSQPLGTLKWDIARLLGPDRCYGNWLMTL